MSEQAKIECIKCLISLIITFLFLILVDDVLNYVDGVSKAFQESSNTQVEYEVTENGLERVSIEENTIQPEEPSTSEIEVNTETIANIEPKEKEISIPLVIGLSLLYTILVLIIGGIISFYGVVWYLIKEREEEVEWENKKE